MESPPHGGEALSSKAVWKFFVADTFLLEPPGLLEEEKALENLDLDENYGGWGRERGTQQC